MEKRVLIIDILILLLLLIFTVIHTQAQSRYLTLEEAITRALNQNNQVKAGEFNLEKAKWDRLQAWSQLVPTVTFNTRYMWIDDRTYAERDFRRYMPEEMQKNMPQTVFQETYASSFDFAMPIFNGILMNGIDIANANLDASEQMNTSTRQNIIFLVIKTYLDVAKNKETVLLQKEYLNLSKMNYEKAERMKAASRYSETETLRWKVEFEQQKATVVQAENLLRSSIIQLSRLINSPVEKEEILVSIPAKLTTEIDNILTTNDEEILKLAELKTEELTKINAQLSSLKSNTEISRLMYKNNYSAFLPVVNASYSYSWRENNTLALDDYSPKTFSINLSFPIFSGFQSYTKLKSSYFDYKKNEENFNDQVLNTRFLITENINRILNLRTQRSLAESGYQLSEKNYTTVEKKKDEGLISNIEFIDAKLNLQNARFTKINVNYDLISSVVELFYMLGRIETIMN